jgi:hypothetical protein
MGGQGSGGNVLAAVSQLLHTGVRTTFTGKTVYGNNSFLFSSSSMANSTGMDNSLMVNYRRSKMDFKQVILCRV